MMDHLMYHMREMFTNYASVHRVPTCPTHLLLDDFQLTKIRIIRDNQSPAII